MGLLRRLFTDTDVRPMAYREDEVSFLGGSHDLEVVGESHYQPALWRAVGGHTTRRVRSQARFCLVAEQDNPHDANAIAVRIGTATVGHLARADAAEYRPGLLALQARHGSLIGLSGVIVGGGSGEGRLGLLGVWLSHEPADFGVVDAAPPLPPVVAVRLRTGLTEALATDAQDDSYDLSWSRAVPADHLAAVRYLRAQLEHDPDPIDRHYLYCELEQRLYRSRDAFASALDEYDDACRGHDGEMAVIRDALLAKFGRVPVLATYTQAAIRHQKARNLAEAAWWARRGLALYGENAARPEVVEDLRRRLAGYESRLDG